MRVDVTGGPLGGTSLYMAELHLGQEANGQFYHTHSVITPPRLELIREDQLDDPVDYLTFERVTHYYLYRVWANGSPVRLYPMLMDGEVVIEYWEWPGYLEWRSLRWVGSRSSTGVVQGQVPRWPTPGEGGVVPGPTTAGGQAPTKATGLGEYHATIHVGPGHGR